MGTWSPSDWINFWVLIVAALVAAGGLVGWLMRLERRISNKLSREDHDDICNQSRAALQAQLDTLSTRLEERERATGVHRERVDSKLVTLIAGMAVLQDRAGIDWRQHLARSAPGSIDGG